MRAFSDLGALIVATLHYFTDLWGHQEPLMDTGTWTAILETHSAPSQRMGRGIILSKSSSWCIHDTELNFWSGLLLKVTKGLRTTLRLKLPHWLGQTLTLVPLIYLTQLRLATSLVGLCTFRLWHPPRPKSINVCHSLLRLIYVDSYFLRQHFWSD